MKKLVIIAALIIGGVSMESFLEQSAIQKNNENKIGVWKTYEDFVNGNLTDLGKVTENHNSWKDGGIFFDKEHVMVETTKYWGVRRPQFMLQPHSFVKHDIPVDNTSVPLRMFGGKFYHILVNPMPIGIYVFGKGKIALKYDSKGDVIDMKNMDEYDAILYCGKGGGDVIRTHEREDMRSMFEDDPEILKEFDNDETFKGHVQTATKQTIVFIKYVMKYNKKHTPGYTSEMKEYLVKK